MADCVVFSGGIDNESYGSFPAEKVLPLLQKLGVPVDAVVLEQKSENTHDQALDMVRLMIEKGWKRIILVASHYHQYRAYLTFLKAVFDAKQSLLVYNAPASDLSWFSDPGWGRRIDLLDREFRKIDDYFRLGHLASFEQALLYQEWKELQQ
jgi:uncharacterized SAM-binding protein YcdF (DUF218 family)